MTSQNALGDCGQQVKPIDTGRAWLMNGTVSYKGLRYEVITMILLFEGIQ